jgi:hypothetical protein
MSIWKKLFGGSSPASKLPTRLYRGPDGEVVITGDVKKVMDDLAAGQTCILCGSTLKSDRCKKGHDTLMYYALNGEWVTSSKKVADRLIAKGYQYTLNQSGSMWKFRP